ncbi:MAG: F0F1 ATP synthase subunit B [Thermoleophilia bacterium]
MEIFSIDPGLFLWSLLTFVLLVILLYKFAYGPLMEMQQKRQDEIHEAIKEAERLREEAQALISDYRSQMASAREEAEKILEQARKVGESTRSEILAEAQAQAERSIEKSREQIQRETREALEQIKREVTDLTVIATEKVTRKTLSEKDQLNLIKQTIAEIDFEQLSEN